MSKPRKRASDLLVDAIGWVETSASSGAIAELDEDTSDLEVVVNSEAEETDADVVVGLAVIASSSTRENRRERKTLAVDAEVSVTTGWVKRHGVLGVSRIADALADELTTHRDGWRALGETGGTDGPLHDEQRSRYLEVRRCDLERID